MTVVVIAAINVNVAFQEKGLSNLSLANLETLAQNESGGGSLTTCCDSNQPQYFCTALSCRCGVSSSTDGTTYGKPVGMKGKCVCGGNFEDCK